MASTYSDRLRLELQATGENSATWGTKANTVFELIDEAIAGFLSIAMGDANVALTATNGASDQSRQAILKVTGANTAVRDIVAPAEEKLYVIHNATTGGYGVRIIVAGTAVTVANGDKVLVYCDGTDFYEVGKTYQSLDATLTAIAGASTGADVLHYFSGSDTVSTTTLTSFGRSLIDDANASAARTTLELVVGTNVQAYDAELAALAGLTSAADKVPYFTGSGTAAVTDLTSAARTLLDDASTSAMRTTLGVAVGTDVQAYDAELAALAGLTSAANKVPMFSGSGTATVIDFKDEDNMASNSDTAVPSQQSLVAYAVAKAGSTMSGTLAMADNLITRPKFTDYGETVNAIGSIGGGTQDIDITLGNVVTGTVDTSTTTFTFSNPSASGTACSFTLILTNGGSQTVNWPASVKWAGNIDPTLTAAGVDILTFVTVDAGTTWYGFVAGIAMS